LFDALGPEMKFVSPVDTLSTESWDRDDWASGPREVLERELGLELELELEFEELVVAPLEMEVVPGIKLIDCDGFIVVGVEGLVGEAPAVTTRK